LFPLLFPNQTSYPALAKTNAGASVSKWLIHVSADEKRPCYKRMAGASPLYI